VKKFAYWPQDREAISREVEEEEVVEEEGGEGEGGRQSHVK